MTYELLVTAPAQRSLSKLPGRAMHAVAKFMTGPLLEDPRRVGKPLRDEFVGLWSARVGQYRILYEILESVRVVSIIRVAHRGDVYRSR